MPSSHRIADERYDSSRRTGLIDDLAGMALFRDLSISALHDVRACASVRQLPSQTTVFAQGQQAVRCHVLVDGRVRIAQLDENGSQLLVRFIGTGEMFGTVGLFTDGAYPAEAVTVVDSIEASWSEASMFDLIGRHPQIAVNMLKVLGGRIKEVQQRFRELATQRVECRIARVLLRLAEQAGRDERSGTTIGFPLTRKDVADMCGATLHTVSRVLASWEKDGWIESGRRRVTICDLSTLYRIADDLPN
jgi:CRP-like cAMP-binding protein